MIGINTFNKIKTNLLSMVKNRKIDIESRIEKQSFIYFPNKLFVKFLLKPNIKPVDIKNEIEKIIQLSEKQSYNFKKLMLILLSKPNNSIIKLVKLYKKQYDIQIFIKNELVIDKIKHKLVPKHVLIQDPTEIEEILKKFKLKSVNKLPFILKSDPMVKYYDANTGNIFKIIRNSITSGNYETYRYVY